MSDIAIRVENLSKQYCIGGPKASYKTLRESLTDVATALFRRLSSVAATRSEGGGGHRCTQIEQIIKRKICVCLC